MITDKNARFELFVPDLHFRCPQDCPIQDPFKVFIRVNPCNPWLEIFLFPNGGTLEGVRFD